MADIQQYIDQLQEFDINDIDWDRVGVWPLVIRILVFIVSVILVLVACHFMFIKERNAAFDIAASKESTLRKSFETKAYDAANLERYRAQMVEMEESFGALVSRLPSDTEVPGLIEDIDDKGVESRLSIESIDLQAEVSTEFHIELPIRIVVSGGYHEFGAFVSGVAGMPRIVTLHDFSIREKSAASGLLRMEMVAKTYRYKQGED